MSVTPAPTFALTDCLFKVKIKDGLDFPHIRKDITVKAYHPLHGCVGTLYAHRIDRKPCNIRGDFHQVMDTSETDDLPTFATTLFDKYGRLKPELTANEHLKGTGAFGHELDDGILLVVVVVRVPPEFRRRGIASHLLSLLAHSPYGVEAVAVIACPRSIERVEGRYVRAMQKSVAENLFLESSYRKIGRTPFFAYAIDSTHPSRFISIEDDIARTRVGENLLSGHSGPAYNLNDGDYEKHHDSTLFDTALHACLPAVRALLAPPLSGQVLNELFSRDNAKGLTPLEVCEQRQRDLREEQEVDPLRLWRGYNTDALRVIYLLKRAMGEDNGMSEEEFVRRRRWGCTCEHCSEGWLSPRMRYALSYIAAGNVDLIGEATEYCDIPNISCEDLPGFQQFPPIVQRAGIQTAAFCEAYANINGAIVGVLQIPGVRGIPTADNVTAMVGDSATAFFRKGGRVEHALAYTLTTAAEEASAYYMSLLPQKPHIPVRLAHQSDQEYDTICRLAAVWGEDYNTIRDLMGNAAYCALPACDNDLNFALVALKLGLDDPESFLPPPPRPCSPQRDMDRDDSDSDMHSDVDSDSGSESADVEDDEDDEDIEATEEEHDDEDYEEYDEDEDTYKDSEPPRKRMCM